MSPRASAGGMRLLPRLPSVPVVLLLVAALAPTAAAAPPACAAITVAGLTPLGPYTEQGNDFAQHKVWAESNLVEGLQKVECVRADGSVAAPDYYLGEFGVDSPGLPICVPRIGCIW